MTPAAIAREAERLRTSSAYRYGDPTSFSVPLTTEVSLPGPADPGLYLDKLNLTVLPERVLVVCPGNGGLVAECLRRGAKFVHALEPRDRFQGPLNTVLALLAKALRSEQKEGLAFRTSTAYPVTQDELEKLETFDLILFTEGHEEITTPRDVFHGLAKCLDANGALFVEITHGNNPWTDRINSWRPSGDATLAMAKDCFGGVWTGKFPGRKDNGRIYKLQLVGGKASKKAAPKKEEVKETAPPPPPPPPKKEEKQVPPKKEAPPKEESKAKKTPLKTKPKPKPEGD